MAVIKIQRRFSSIWIFSSIILTFVLTPGKSFPTTTVSSDTTTWRDDVTEPPIPIEIEVTEMPPSLNDSTNQIPENYGDIAVTEIIIIEDTPDSTNFLATDTDDASTTFSPNSKAIIETELEDSNTASEEFDQSTNNTTHLTEEEIIEPDPDKKEILSELENIWHYTNELGEDQNELKNSLSYLIHMTYARVYEQSDEILGKLKQRLRILRARLLNQAPNTQVQDDPSITTSPIINSDTSEANNYSPTLENESTTLQNIKSNDSSQEILHRQKRNDLGQREYNERRILAGANPNENSLFPQEEKKSAEWQNNNATEIPYIPQGSRSHSGEAIVQQTINVKNSNNLGDEDDNYVHVTIFQPDNKRNETKMSTWPYFYQTSTMPTRFPFKSNTNTKFQSISAFNVTKLKEKYNLFTTQKNTEKPTISIQPSHEDFIWSDEQISENTISTTVNDIIQSIISVLKSPITKPASNNDNKIQETPQEEVSPSSSPSNGQVASLSSVSTTEVQNENNKIPVETNPTVKSTSEIFYDPVTLENQVKDTLPSYVQKIAEGLGLGETPNGNLHNNNYTRVFTYSNSSIVKDSNSTGESVNIEVVLTPTKLVDKTMSQLYKIVQTFANMPNAVRFVLFFSIAISVVSIALGLYSLGPPIAGLGVLGIIVPVFLVFLVQSKTAKSKKSTHDIWNTLKVDDFIYALDLIADAMIKYEKP